MATVPSVITETLKSAITSILVALDPRPAQGLMGDIYQNVPWGDRPGSVSWNRLRKDGLTYGGKATMIFMDCSKHFATVSTELKGLTIPDLLQEEMQKQWSPIQAAYNHLHSQLVEGRSSIQELAHRVQDLGASFLAVYLLFVAREAKYHPKEALAALQYTTIPPLTPNFQRPGGEEEEEEEDVVGDLLRSDDDEEDFDPIPTGDDSGGKAGPSREGGSSLSSRLQEEKQLKQALLNSLTAAGSHWTEPSQRLPSAAAGVGNGTESSEGAMADPFGRPPRTILDNGQTYKSYKEALEAAKEQSLLENLQRSPESPPQPAPAPAGQERGRRYGKRPLSP